MFSIKEEKEERMTKSETRTLTKKYGWLTSEVVRAKENNRKKYLTSLRKTYGIGTVAAILANHTRGTYDDSLDADRLSSYNCFTF